MLGWPGVPDSWCWPNQNDTSAEAVQIRAQLQRNAKGGLPCSRGPQHADEEGRCSIDLAIAQVRTHAIYYGLVVEGSMLRDCL